MLKLKLQYFGYLMQRTDSLEKILTLGKTEGKGEGVVKDEIVRQQCQFNGCEFEQTLVDSEGQGSLAWCSTWGHKELDIETEQQQCFICSSLSQSYFSTIFTLLPRFQISWVSLLFLLPLWFFIFIFFFFQNVI